MVNLILIFMIIRIIENKRTNLKIVLKNIEIEGVIWISALILLAFSDPYNEYHFTLFPPDLLFGIKSPGYGLGHSISFLFRFEFIKSFNSHPLGLFALAVLGWRSYFLLKKSFLKIKLSRYHNG